MLGTNVKIHWWGAKNEYAVPTHTHPYYPYWFNAAGQRVPSANKLHSSWKPDIQQDFEDVFWSSVTWGFQLTSLFKIPAPVLVVVKNNIRVNWESDTLERKKFAIHGTNV